MAYCPYCGCEIEEELGYCPSCSGELDFPRETIPVSNDKGGFWWGLLGCCVPLAGLIMFFVWHDSKPKTAKALGIGALVFVICLVVFWILVFGLGIFAFGHILSNFG